MMSWATGTESEDEWAVAHLARYIWVSYQERLKLVLTL